MKELRIELNDKVSEMERLQSELIRRDLEEETEEPAQSSLKTVIATLEKENVNLKTKIIPDFVLFFDWSEEEMDTRLLNRNQGRVDDNIETIRKRFEVFTESSLPVIEYYSSKGKVRKIDAGKPVEEVFEDVKSVFSLAIKNVRHLLAVQCS
ncbi:UMP-CMP kinase 4-like [Magnolia sinica]|uniref:UMP-CMP kinase 4-like n=1 Tax=Magnolia sinica TaxID=86752 RepID=UPI0026588224|nr:UMP-CMP kinase 4-like [Magnolia sinica]XP_058068787.1 UMP-CMP kinase 4-like [Magnolia sinica]